MFTDVIELILAAGYTSKQYKGSIVRKASSKFDSLKLFMRIAWELGLLDHKQYARISQPLDDVGKMLGGWLKQVQAIPDSTSQ